MNVISVALLPLLRTRDIICERLRLENTSAIPGHHFRGLDFLKATASFIPQKPIKSHVEQRCTPSGLGAAPATNWRSPIFRTVAATAFLPFLHASPSTRA